MELAQYIEQEGFSGIYCPSFGNGMGLCEALALVTRELPFGTSIANIYTRHASDYAQTAALIHELSGGRFRFGIGMSHGPTHQRLGQQVGQPLGDIRKFVNNLRIGTQQAGELPLVWSHGEWMVEESAGCMSSLALAALADVDVLYLTTMGRHSGLPRTIEIWFTYHAGKLFLNAERRHAAQWVQNVLHDPLVQVRLKQHEFAGQARVLDLHSESELWQTVVELSRRKYGWGEGLPVEIIPL